jgi:hypothetical protein
MGQDRVALVAAPWQLPTMPSIQLGILTNVLRRAGLDVQPFSLHLDWADRVIRASTSWERPLTLERVVHFAHECRDDRLGIPESVFAGLARDEETPFDVGEYEKFLYRYGTSQETVETIRRLRACADRAVREWSEQILAWQPSVVGLSTTVNQNMASLALARAIKTRALFQPA